MNPEQHRRIADAFSTAHDLSDTRREEYLAELTQGDPELAAAVRSLLEADERDVELLDTPEHGGLVRWMVEAETLSSGTTIGGYEILGFLAAGGMGAVYRARQRSPRRVVALKVMRQGLTRKSSVRRFQQEAQLLARLRHPGIAEVIEADVYDQGGLKVPFVVLEYVHAAQTLTQYAAHTEADRRAKLDLFLQACEAVQHGHRNGVIHCDLKPDNVLVNEDGRVKVIDFGIARVVDPEHQASTLLTGGGQLLGTVPYMSPEQLEGSPERIDTRTDVYALGVLLFELLSGQLPIEVRGLGFWEATATVRESSPKRLGDLVPACRGDLDVIAAKALEKDRDQRYASVDALAEDLRRVLRSEPILARPPQLLYLLRKFARRHRGLVAGGALAAVSLVAGSVLSLNQARLAHLARDEAREGERTSRRSSYRSSITAAAAALDMHDTGLAARSLAEAPEELRRWEWTHLASQIDESSARLDTASLGPIQGPLSFVQDELGLHLRLVAGSRIVDLEPRRLVREETEAGAEATTRVAADRSGEHAVRLAGRVLEFRDRAGLLRRVDLAALDERFASEAPADSLAVDEAGTSVAIGSPQRVWHYSLESGVLRSVAIDRSGTGVERLAVGANGRVAIAAASAGGRPALWTPGGSLEDLPDVPDFVRSVAFTPGGDRLLLGLQDCRIAVIALDGSAPMMLRRAHDHAVTDVASSPDGSRIASVGLDHTLRLWRAADLEPLALYRGHDSGIRAVVFSPDDSRLVTLDERGGLRTWDARRLVPPGVLAGHSGFVWPVEYDPSGTLLASAGWDGTVRLWDPDAETLVAVLAHGSPVVTALAFSTDGRYLALSAKDGDRVFDLYGDGPLVASVPRPRSAPGSVRLLSFLPGSDRLLDTWSLDTPNALVVDPRTAEESRIARSTLRGGVASCTDPSGRFLVHPLRRAETDGDVRSADRDLGNALGVLDLTTDADLPLPPLSRTFAFHRDETGRIVFAARSGVDTRRVELYELPSCELLATFEGHSAAVFDLDLHADGTRLVTAGRNTIRLWDTQTGAEIVSLHGHTSFVWSVTFRPDGTQLATGSGDGLVRLWNTRSVSAVEEARTRSREREASVASSVLEALRQPGGALALREGLRARGADRESQSAALRVVLRERCERH